MKALFMVAITTLAGSLLAAPPPDEALRRALPAPELYGRHRAALALTPAQAETIRAATAEMTRELRDLTPALEERTRALAAAVEDAATPPDEVQRRLDAVLEIENRMKAVRLRASLVARRALTPEQWEKLAALIPSASEPVAAAAEPTREDLQKKLARLRLLSAEVFPDGPPADFRNRFNRAQNKMRADQPAETARLFDDLLAELEQRRAASPATTRP